MTFDGKTSHAAAGGSNKEPSMGLRSIIQEIIAIGVIVAIAAHVVVLMDLKEVVKRHNELASQQVTVTHSTALVIENLLARTESREPSGEAKGFRMPPKRDPAE